MKILQTVQSCGDRKLLGGKYVPSKLYTATQDTEGGSGRSHEAGTGLELRLRAGDLVGVIQQKDPSGNRELWFCDNGQAKGFVAASLLAPSPMPSSKEEVMMMRSSEEEVGAERPVAVVAPYDEAWVNNLQKNRKKNNYF